MIVISYNHSRYVVETLESVKAQKYTPTELIIVDDCSPDDSVAVIDNWLRENGINCTFIRHDKNQGVCRSLNDALAAARGKYISMVASDDLWLPDKIVRQVEIMESQPDDVGVLYSDVLQIDEDGQPMSGLHMASAWKISTLPEGRILDSLMEGNFVPGQSALVRRSCYQKVGPYDENLPWEDWDMWMRIARHYSFVFSPTPSAKYRIHKNSYSHSDPVRMARDACHICLKQFDMGGLTPDQKSRLARLAVNMSERLYEKEAKEAASVLLLLSRATGNKKAQWMYRFAKFGVPFRNWRRALSCRTKLLSVRKTISGSA